MSIEKTIEENTAALVALTAVIQAAGRVPAGFSGTVLAAVRPAAVLAPAEVLPEEPAVKKPASGKPSSGTAKEPPPSAAPSATGAATESSATAEAFEFATLANAGVALVQAGKREALVAILAEYKAVKLSALPEAVWPEVYKRIQDVQVAE